MYVISNNTFMDNYVAEIGYLGLNNMDGDIERVEVRELSEAELVEIWGRVPDVGRTFTTITDDNAFELHYRRIS